ncbi:hypothetical protein Mal15_11380 [Stieleria maiorica]|uniref:Bacterial SH3 domain protein n=1 Tax=Stieleria maiorica TaxID=2795974 RepID=A0A5B9M7I7_9BACT|nr:hypothetical protein [Stieleria maiorica]QEF97102.1 hypothetical protein Mal15_11380 [Stieleria maiorica]
MDVLSLPKRFCAHHTLSTLPLLFALALGLIALTVLSPVSQAQQPDIPAAAEDDLSPYIVFVAQPSAFTRCGPGTDNYRTEPLRRGQELEVYVETGDGWLGVRPPEGSFCWMPADAVELSADEKNATIREDKTVAWIGTRLGKARRYRWQVQLDAGEVVSVLGKNQREGSGGTKTWLRIVPPSGEFRWIHRDDVVETAEQLADRVASGEPELQRRGEVAPAALTEVAQEDAGGQTGQQGRPAPKLAQLNPADASQAPEQRSSRRGTATESLRETDAIPELRPAPERSDIASKRPQPRELADRAIQFHRGAEAEDFEDRGAVIGSGLKAEWKDDAAQSDTSGLIPEAGSNSILSADRLTEVPTNGAAAAAAAIATPLKRMTDVVANFISPPRLVEIDPSGAGVFRTASTADRRWTVGSGRSSDSVTGAASLAPPASLATPQPGSFANLPQAQYPEPPSPQVPSPLAPASGVMQTGALQATTLSPIPPKPSVPSRIVTVQQIARVEDAVAGAGVDAIGQILSKLMAEAASADELDPLIRRTESLLRSGDVNQASRTRELLALAQRYRNVAARRDGVTTIQSSSLASNTQPLVNSAPLVSPRPLTGVDPNATAIQQAGAQTATDFSQPLDVTPQSTSPTAPLDSAVGTATGYLVQVYSSRANSPPYALTDDAGLTIAYVTPYPGVNLRTHLNSRVAVSGNEKLLEGMSTPHILVDRAIRR